MERGRLGIRERGEGAHRRQLSSTPPSYLPFGTPRNRRGEKGKGGRTGPSIEEKDDLLHFTPLLLSARRPSEKKKRAYKRRVSQRGRERERRKMNVLSLTCAEGRKREEEKRKKRPRGKIGGRE